MQGELDTTTTALPIHLFGVNEAGHESGNFQMTEGMSIPLLQDTPGVNAWGSWQVTLRDLVFLNTQNKVILVYNLTTHDLTDTVNFNFVKNQLLQAAGATHAERWSAR
jgi:hypothetical protein